METIPRKSATLALIPRDGCLCLGEKIRKGADIGEGTLNGPGGKWNPEAETIEENLEDEVFTEIGVKVIAARKVAEISFQNGTRNIFDVHVFLVTAFEGEPRASDEMRMPDGGWWHSINALPFNRMLASDHVWMPRVLNGELIRGTVLQNDDGSLLISSTFDSVTEF